MADTSGFAYFLGDLRWWSRLMSPPPPGTPPGMTEEFGSPRSAIVTGGAKRIGAAMVRALAEDGWHVVIHCNTSIAAAMALRDDVHRIRGRTRHRTRPASIGAAARKAWPRWLIASFSAGSNSALVRVCPSATKIGS